MSRNIWVISDTHFQHNNILNFKGNDGLPFRMFNDVQEMNEIMIQRWNEVVKPGDKVYHLGDVVMGVDSEGWMKKNWPRLMGQKRLIVGNHDNIKMLSSGGFFAKVELWRVFSEFGIILSHIPLHESGLYRGAGEGYTMLNVHGHINEKDSPKGPYRNVCVEKINYRPINIEELRIK